LREYVAAIRAFAGERGLPLVDVDAAFRHFQCAELPCWDSLLLDGMHPNDAGHQLVADLLLPTLNALMNLSVETPER
jgi:lysophospholipase L1-like esterase